MIQSGRNSTPIRLSCLRARQPIEHRPATIVDAGRAHFPAVGERPQQIGQLCVAVPFHEPRHAVAPVPAARLADDRQRGVTNVGQDELWNGTARRSRRRCRARSCSAQSAGRFRPISSARSTSGTSGPNRPAATAARDVELPFPIETENVGSCAGFWTPATTKLSARSASRRPKSVEARSRGEFGRPCERPALWGFDFHAGYGGGREAGARRPGQGAERGLEARNGDLGGGVKGMNGRSTG